jgi:hypothetical protein
MWVNTIRRSDMRSIILALAAGVALGASSYVHAQATKPRPGAQLFAAE